MRLVSTRLTTAGRLITLKLRCPATTVGRCSGQTKLSAPRRNAGVALGQVGFSIASGKEATLRLRVSRPGRRLFSRTSRLRGRATNTARDGAGQAKTTVAAVTIRRRALR